MIAAILNPLGIREGCFKPFEVSIYCPVGTQKEQRVDEFNFILEH